MSSNIEVQDLEANEIIDENGLVWIPIAVAAKLVPSVRPGKATHVTQIKKLIEAGTLKAKVRKMGRSQWWYVRRDEVLGLNELEDPPKAEATAHRGTQKATTRKTLQRMRGKS